MAKPLKYLIGLVVLIAIIVSGLVVLVQTQVTSDKIRTHLLPIAEQRLQRKIEFGDIEIGLLSGVTVADLKVKQKNSPADFISVNFLKLNYRLWSLLQGKIEIDQVVLDQPQIQITRFSNGDYNFKDLNDGIKKPSAGQSGQDQKSSSKSVADIPLRLLVKEVKISDGFVNFTDQFRNERTPYRFKLDRLNLEAKKITLDDVFPINLSLQLNDAQIDISGHYNVATHSGDLLIHSAPVNLLPFAPYLRDRLPFKLGSAEMVTTLEVDINPESIVSKGQLKFAQLDLSYKQDSHLQLKDATLAADYALSYDFARKTLDLSTLLINLNDLSAGVEGQIDLSRDDPTLVSMVTFDQIDLRQVMQVVPAHYVRDVQQYSPAGTVSGQMKLAGPVSRGQELLESAALNLDNVQISVRNIRAGVSGNLTYHDRVVNAENLLLKYGELEASLNLKAEDLFEPLPRANFQLTAKALDLNHLVSHSSEQSQSPVMSQPPVQTANLYRGVSQNLVVDEVGPFYIAAVVSGRVDAEEVVYKKLQLQKFGADLSLKDNRLLMSNIRAFLDGGQLNGAAVVDLGIKGLGYRGQIDLAQANISTLVAGLVRQNAPAVSGRLLLNCNFSGRGINETSLRNNLELKGNYSLAEGRIQGTPVLNGLASLLGHPDLKILSFNSVAGKYHLDQGLVHLSGDLNSSKIELSPQGTVGLDGRMNLQMKTRISPELMTRMGKSNSLRQVVIDQQGWGQLPLTIGGTMTHPQVNFDTRGLSQQAVEKAREKAAEKLMEKINGTETAKEPIRQLLDKTLNKLFDR